MFIPTKSFYSNKGWALSFTLLWVLDLGPSPCLPHSTHQNQLQCSQKPMNRYKFCWYLKSPNLFKQTAHLVFICSHLTAFDYQVCGQLLCVSACCQKWRTTNYHDHCFSLICILFHFDRFVLGSFWSVVLSFSNILHQFNIYMEITK